MSRIGKKPIKISEKVKVEIAEDTVKVTGPKGSLSLSLAGKVKVKLEDGQLIFFDAENAAFWGLFRSRVSNMVVGCETGFEKVLVLKGVGYRAQKSGQKLVLQLGYSHPVEVDAPSGIEFQVQKEKITISGADKEQVGQVAAYVRSLRPVEPYKGKGIMYENEKVRRKAGKAAKAGG